MKEVYIMGSKKHMHYLSQMISRNFIAPNSPHTFLQYDPAQEKIEPRNIRRLFSRYKPWSQEFEEFLAGNTYENKLAPLLKELVCLPIKRLFIYKRNGIEEAQFYAETITEEEKQKLLSKLFLQTILLQRSDEKPQSDVESELEHLFLSGFALKFHLLLVEINPRYICPPLILTDGMVFEFICPDDNKKSLGHLGFMFPISEKRFLLWVSQRSDYTYFCAKYKNINYLNLCRIEQHDKKCTIALAKTEYNEIYLKSLIREIPFFSSSETVQISTEREWM